MARITKSPEDRKEEFLETAMTLFDENGYEHTTVDMIVNRMGVAKGLFYHYFKSKEDLLDIIVDRLIVQTKEGIDSVAGKKELSCLRRMRELFDAISRMRRNSYALIDFFHEERNRQIHHAIESQVMKSLVPAFEEIIRAGIKEGIFDTKYPRETAIAFLSSTSYTGHLMKGKSDPKEIRRYMRFLQDYSEKVFGAKPGTLSFYMEYTEEAIKTIDKMKPKNGGS